MGGRGCHSTPDLIYRGGGGEEGGGGGGGGGGRHSTPDAFWQKTILEDL